MPSTPPSSEYTKVTKVSDFIETEPYGGVEQDDFLNGCIEVETLHSPDELSTEVKIQQTKRVIRAPGDDWPKLHRCNERKRRKCRK